MDEYHKHRKDCQFAFAPLDVCDCVQKNMADRIQALEARIAKADALAEAVGNATRMKVSPVTAGGRLRLEVDLQRLDAALAAYREGSDT